VTSRHAQRWALSYKVVATLAPIKKLEFSDR
jgi:hypothetical protein